MFSTDSMLSGGMALLVAAAVLAGGHAQAGTVSVSQPQCGAEVALVADDAMLSDVFKELAAQMGFALRFDRDSDRKVTIELTSKPEKLIESLTRDDNVMITTQDDPGCAGNTRITDVRFLAAGNPIVVPAHVPATAPPMAPVSALTPSRPKVPKIDDAYRKQKLRRRDMTQEERALDHDSQRREKLQ